MPSPVTTMLKGLSTGAPASGPKDVHRPFRKRMSGIPICSVNTQIVPSRVSCMADTRCGAGGAGRKCS